MSNKNLLVTKNPDFYYAVTKAGHYPELATKIKTNELELVQFQDIVNTNLLAIQPEYDTEYYVINEFDGRYYPLGQSRLESDMERLKTAKCCEALSMLGAKDVSIKSQKTGHIVKDLKFNANASKRRKHSKKISRRNQANLDGGYKSDKQYTFYVKYDIYAPANNMEPINVIDKLFEDCPGLQGIAEINALYDEIKRSGKPLNGRRRIEIKYNEELEQSLNMALGLSIPLKGAYSANLNANKKNIRDITLQLDVDFGTNGAPTPKREL